MEHRSRIDFFSDTYPLKEKDNVYHSNLKKKVDKKVEDDMIVVWQQLHKKECNK